MIVPQIKRLGHRPVWGDDEIICSNCGRVLGRQSERDPLGYDFRFPMLKCENPKGDK